MATGASILSVLLLVLATAAAVSSASKQGLNLEMAKALVSEAKAYCDLAHDDQHYQQLLAAGATPSTPTHHRRLAALGDCAKLYGEAEPRLDQLMTSSAVHMEDAGIWLSAVLTSHTGCVDGLRKTGPAGGVEVPPTARNLTSVLADALAFYANNSKTRHPHQQVSNNGNAEGDEYGGGILRSWDPVKSKADMVVARDGSGTHRSINAAVAALSSMLEATEEEGERRRVIVYVKAGVYNEKVEIRRGLKNLMFVGDGIHNTIVTGHRNYVDGYTTISTATFDVSGDGFWARDITFENTAGPEKHQAVAIRVSSDHSVFFRCSFRGYQDTLYAHSNRQFYRDCLVSGTVDFIFGNAAAVFQNCDILARRPMDHQSNTVTAHARDNPHEPTGFSIHGSRVRPGPDLAPVQGSFRTFLGRPWRRYARVVVWRTDLDGFIDPRGWTEWDGSFALNTLFYGEYGNVGSGADTHHRVRWPGFHLLRSDGDVRPFTVQNFIDGQRWIPRSGVPVSMDL